MRDALLREAEAAPDSLLAAGGRFAVALVSTAAPGALFDAAHAQIVTDGSAGAAGPVAEVSNNFAIPESLGTLSGANLFHSFQEFSIPAAKSATFSNTTPGIQNVISRVTGGAVSQIDGALVSTVPGADFYFVNPAGVTFGSGANVNVPAAFRVSTAGTINFVGGASIVTTAPTGVFVSAAPASFGFNGAVGNITLNGANLTAHTGAVDFSAANITQSSGQVKTTGPSVRYFAAGAAPATVPVNGAAPTGTLTGVITLTNTSAGSATGAGASADAPDVRAYARAVNLTNSVVSTRVANGSTHNGGDISFIADEATFNRSVILTGMPPGPGAGGDIDFDVADLEFIDTQVMANTEGAGAAGDITINADQLHVNGYGAPLGVIPGVTWNGFNSVTVGSGAAGDITINAGSVAIEGAWIVANTFGVGAGGDVAINATGDFVMENGIAASSSLDAATGDAGDVSVTGATVALTGDGLTRHGLNRYGVGSETYTSGDGGEITIHSVGATLLDGAGASTSAGLGASGKVGDIEFVAGSAIMRNRGGLYAQNLSANSPGAGDIDVEVTGDLLIQGVGGVGPGTGILTVADGGGAAGSIHILADTLTMTNIAKVRADGANGGLGGAVDVQARLVNLSGHGPDNFTGIQSKGGGPNSSVTVRGQEIRVADEAHISSDLEADNGRDNGQAGNVLISATSLVRFESGGGATAGATSNTLHNAGNLRIEAPIIELVDGVAVSHAGTGSLGHAGNVTLAATNRVSILRGAVLSTTDGAGDAGNILISAPTVTSEQSYIASGSGSHATGDAGDVTINGDVITIRGHVLPPVFAGANDVNADNGFGGVSSTTTASGAGGDVRITGTTRINLDDTQIISMREEGSLDGGPPGTGAGGSVHLTAPTIDIGRSFVSTLTSGQGAGGDVVINAPTLLTLHDESLVSAQTIGPGNAGDVRVAAGAVAVAGSTSQRNWLAALAGPAFGFEVAPEGSGFASSAVGPATGAAGSVDIEADSLVMTGGAFIASTAGAAASAAGGVGIRADQISIDGGAVSASTTGAARAGDIAIQADTLALLNGGTILTDAGDGAGAAGNVTVNAREVRVTGATSTGSARRHSNIGAFAGPGAGRAGDVTIRADALRLLEGGQITAFANNAAGGGTVTIDADTVEVSGTANAALAGLPALYGVNLQVDGVGLNSALIADTFSSGKAGTIIVRARNISFLNGGMARSNTSSSGTGGTIIVCADGTILIDGVGSAVIANSSAGSTGNAGLIGVQADTLELARGGRVTVATAGTGQGGQIVVQAHDVDLSNEGGSANPGEATGITTLVSGAAGAASVQGAGQVTVFAGEMNVAGGSVVTTDSTGAAPAGRIVIRAGTLDIRGASTTVSSAAVGAAKGSAGVIDIGAYNVELNGAKISTFSESGSGGQVTFSVDNQILLVKGEITTQVRGATSDSNAGNIYIGVKAAAPSFTNPCEGVCTPGFDPFLGVTRPNLETGTGVPKAYVNEETYIRASADQGRGGAIAISADTRIDNGTVIADPDSFYDISSNAGLDGTVTAQGATFAMPAFIPPPDDEQRSMCEAQRAGFENQLEQALGRRSEDPTVPRFMAYDEPAEQRLALAGSDSAACETAKEDELWTPSLFGRRLP